MKYNILDYGAKTDGTLCTENIQKAIDECFLNGGGEVVIPGGEYLTGGLRLRSGITLHLLENAVLKGSICPEDYATYINDKIEPIPPEDIEKPVSTIVPDWEPTRSVIPYSRWNNAVIRAINAKNISIIGEKGSEINGQNCFDEQGEEDYRGPHGINMWFCENIVLEGYTIKDCGNWGHAIQNSKNISAKGLCVLGGHDGFDVRTCDNILIENCRFLTGDDCIAGFDNIDVIVKDCYFESGCSLLRFGGTNVLVENCQGVAPATYGFRGHLSYEEKRNRAEATDKCGRNCRHIFLYYCDNRANIRKTPGNILIKNSKFINPDKIIGLPFGHIWCCNRSLNDITFENCIMEGVCTPIDVDAPENEPLCVYIKDCAITPRKGFEDVAFIKGKNIKELQLVRTSLEGFTNPGVESVD